MSIASMDPDNYEEPTGLPLQYWKYWLLGSSLVSLLCFAFWLWMFIDCYRRRSGLDYWHYLFLIVPPSCVVYFVLHFKQIASGRGGASLFGPSVKSRIKTAQRNLRVTDTIAARAELAELLFEDGQYEDCEAEFNKVLRFDPKNLEALYHIGMCKLKRNNAAGALEYLKQVMERDRKLRFGNAWLNYTECLVAVGKLDDALDERKKLSRSFPRPLTEFAYAKLLADSGERGRAREVLEEMLATSDNAPREDRVWLKQGKALLRTVSARTAG